MITVFEGFMILSGAISGNLVMYEMEGLPPYRLGLYGVAICIILAGLYVLLTGEIAAQQGTTLLKSTRTAHADAEGGTHELTEAQAELQQVHADVAAGISPQGSPKRDPRDIEAEE
jgi:hypothetical protein